MFSHQTCRKTFPREREGYCGPHRTGYFVLLLLLAAVAVVSVSAVLGDQSAADTYVDEDNGVEYSYDPNDQPVVATVFYHKDSMPKDVLILSGFTDESGVQQTVTSIGRMAFYQCSFISVTIPNSVTSIGEQAFLECTSLVTVSFGDGSKLESIGNSAFMFCSSLESITIPQGVTSVGEDAFYGCEKLLTITFTAKAWSITIGGDQFALYGPPDIKEDVRSKVYSPNNNADGKLKDYQGDHTTFTYHGIYTVTVKVNDPGWGSVSQTAIGNITEGTSISVDGNVLKVGDDATSTATPAQGTEHCTYEFDKWDGVPKDGKVTGGITVTACFKQVPVDHTVTFDTNGHGDRPDPQTVPDGGKVEKPEDPSAQYYRFDGWYRDKECSADKKWDFANDTVVADITLFAKWVLQAIVFFDANGHGTAPDKISVDKGSKISEPTAPSADGYRFDGWYRDKECSEDKKWDFANDTVDKSLTLFAKWVEQDTVTFDANGHGTAPAADTVDKGSKISEPSAPSADGYTFGGWYRDKECSEDKKWDFTKDTVVDDVTLFAKWTKNGGNVPLIAAAGTAIALLALAGAVFFIRRP